LDRRLGGPQSRSGRGDEEKNSQPLTGIEPPIIKAVAQRYTIEISGSVSSESKWKYLVVVVVVVVVAGGNNTCGTGIAQ
jgi:hypothetical protein